MTFHETLDENNNPEVIEQLRNILREYSFSSKMEMCRKISHILDNYFPYSLAEKKKLKIEEQKPLKLIQDNCHLHEIDLISLLSIIDLENISISELSDYNKFIELINLIRAYNVPFAHINDMNLTDLVNGLTEHWNEISDMLFIRMSLQQFPYQQNFLVDLYRYQWFFSHQTPKFDLKKIFLNEFKLSFDEYVFACSYLFFISRESQNVLTITHVLNQFSNQKNLKSEDIIIILNQLCQPRQTLQENYRQLKSSDERMVNYDFNPLRITPLVIDWNEIYVPIPQLLFQAITKGFYHRLCDEYKKEKFREHFGKEIFEPYVRQVLTWDKVDYEIVPEFPYYKSNQKCLSADFTLIRGNDLILVEAKGTAPSVPLGSSDLKEFISQLNKAYAEGIKQCAAKEDDIRKGILTHRQIPATISQIHYLVITLEDFYIFPTDTVIRQIRKYVESKGVTLPENKPLHLMSINTLEAIMQNDTRSLFDFIMDRVSSDHTFTVATWLDINNKKKQLGELRSIQYFSELIKKYNKRK